MAYTPINWQNGDTITADKMNKMDNGWGVANAQLFNETVTTSGDGMYSASLAYTGLIENGTITVTYDGTSYTCPRIDAFGVHYYGGFSEQGPDFSVYPFALMSSPEFGNRIFTETAGNHTVAVVGKTVEVSGDFEKAVEVAMPESSFQIILGQTTWQEAFYALNAGRDVYVLPYSGERVPILYVGTRQDGELTAYIACGARYGTSSQGLITAFYSASSPDGALQ